MKKHTLSISTLGICVGVLGAVGGTMLPLNSVQAADTQLSFPRQEPSPTNPALFSGWKGGTYDHQQAEQDTQQGVMGPLRSDLASKMHFPGESPNPTEYLGASDADSGSRYGGQGAMGPIRADDLGSVRSFPGESMNPTEYQ